MSRARCFSCSMDSGVVFTISLRVSLFHSAHFAPPANCWCLMAERRTDRGEKSLTLCIYWLKSPQGNKRITNYFPLIFHISRFIVLFHDNFFSTGTKENYKEISNRVELYAKLCPSIFNPLTYSIILCEVIMFKWWLCHSISFLMN